MTRTGGSRARGEAGFTVVEAMVAVVVFGIGVLGLAGTAAVVTRQMSGGNRVASATVLARSRIEQLAAQDCTRLASGSASIPGFSEQWSVVPVTRAVRVTERVTFRGERGTRTKVYVTMLPCPANP